MNIDTGHSCQLLNDEMVHDVTWIPGAGDDILYLRSGGESRKGRTEIVIASGAQVSKEHYIIADINAPIEDLKLKALDDASVAFVVTGLVGKDGSLFNEKAVEKKSTGRIFDTPRVALVS